MAVEKPVVVEVSSKQLALLTAAVSVAQESSIGRARREQNPQIRAIHQKIANDYQELRTFLDGKYSLNLLEKANT